MSENNKPADHSKDQPAKQPAPPSPERNLRPGRTIVGDSASVVRKKDK